MNLKRITMKRDEKINLLASFLFNIIDKNMEEDENGLIYIVPEQLLQICDSYAKGVLDKAFRELNNASTWNLQNDEGYIEYIKIDDAELILYNILNEEE